jgi:hypothetical protein
VPCCPAERESVGAHVIAHESFIDSFQRQDFGFSGTAGKNAPLIAINDITSIRKKTT